MTCGEQAHFPSGFLKALDGLPCLLVTKTKHPRKERLAPGLHSGRVRCPPPFEFSLVKCTGDLNCLGVPQGSSHEDTVFPLLSTLAPAKTSLGKRNWRAHLGYYMLPWHFTIHSFPLFCSSFVSKMKGEITQLHKRTENETGQRVSAAPLRRGPFLSAFPTLWGKTTFPHRAV